MSDNILFQWNLMFVPHDKNIVDYKLEKERKIIQNQTSTHFTRNCPRRQDTF